MNKLIYQNSIFIVLMALFLSSCGIYSNRMFKTKHEIIVDSIQKQTTDADKNYIIRKNDYLILEVFTNAGERLIDPNNALTKDEINKNSEALKYLVRSNGYVNLPMVGDIYIDGYTLFQADSILSLEFAKFYKDVFIITKLVNKRVIVLGPNLTGGGKVILLENENINLIEVIALYGGINEHGKAYNIRLIRGDLKNPNVNIIDLSTIDGMKAASLNVQPNDIIYIEERRSLIGETFKEISPVVSLIVTMATLILIFRQGHL